MCFFFTSLESDFEFMNKKKEIYYIVFSSFEWRRISSVNLWIRPLVSMLAEPFSAITYSLCITVIVFTKEKEAAYFYTMAPGWIVMLFNTTVPQIAILVNR